MHYKDQRLKWSSQGSMVCSLVHQGDYKESMNEILVDGAQWRELHFVSRMDFMLLS